MELWMAQAAVAAVFVVALAGIVASVKYSRRHSINILKPLSSYNAKHWWR